MKFDPAQHSAHELASFIDVWDCCCQDSAANVLADQSLAVRLVSDGDNVALDRCSSHGAGRLQCEVQLMHVPTLVVWPAIYYGCAITALCLCTRVLHATGLSGIYSQALGHNARPVSCITSYNPPTQSNLHGIA